MKREVLDEVKPVVHLAFTMDRETLAVQDGLYELLCLLPRGGAYDNESSVSMNSEDQWIAKVRILMAQLTRKQFAFSPRST